MRGRPLVSLLPHLGDSAELLRYPQITGISITQTVAFVIRPREDWTSVRRWNCGSDVSGGLVGNSKLKGERGERVQPAQWEPPRFVLRGEASNQRRETGNEDKPPMPLAAKLPP